MYKVLRQYFDYPVKTGLNIEDSFDPPFPYITICNNNMARRSALTSRPEWNDTFWKYVREDYKFAGNHTDVEPRKWRGNLRQDLFTAQVRRTDPAFPPFSTNSHLCTD